ncbi:hypothetical protein Q604_UNBC10522G0001, partial [human gut metagenome]
EITEKVINNGETFIGKVNIGGEDMLGQYIPIKKKWFWKSHCNVVCWC